MAEFSLRMDDLRWLPRIAGVLAVSEVVGRRMPLPRLARLLEGTPRGGTHSRTPAELDRLVWLTQGLLRRLYRREFCYPRSLVLFHFLSRWGYPVHLRFGIRRDGERLAGHAWLDLEGRPFAEADDPTAHYRTTFTYPSTPTRSTYGTEPEEQRGSGQSPAQAVRRASAGAAREGASDHRRLD